MSGGNPMGSLNRTGRDHGLMPKRLGAVEQRPRDGTASRRAASARGPTAKSTVGRSPWKTAPPSLHRRFPNRLGPAPATVHPGGPRKPRPQPLKAIPHGGLCTDRRIGWH